MPSGYGRMACIEKETRRLIGFSGLKYLDDRDETDVGYRFLPECWGKGYAIESAAAIMRQQAAQFGLSRIIGLVEPENRGSVRVLQKLGLKFEGRGGGGNAALDLYTIHFAHRREINRLHRTNEDSIPLATENSHVPN